MWRITICCWLLTVVPSERAWVRHTIDDSSRGADGVRLADVNDDGLLDCVTGWEEGGVELLDLDGDGDLDALSCEETKNLGVFWYENPAK